MILTSELAQLRIDARRIFPNAAFLPGDDPPMGAQVLRRNGRTATVIGASTAPGYEYWWALREADTPDGAEILDWPPTLRTADGPSLNEKERS